MQKNELKKENELIKKIENLIKEKKKIIHSLSFKYKFSFKKCCYMLFDSVQDLEDYRLEIIYKQMDLTNEIKKLDEQLYECNRKVVLMYNNLVYLEIMNIKCIE